MSNVAALRRCILVPALLASALLSGAGCAVVRSMAGADIDVAQLEKAREAAVLELRTRSVEALARRLARGPVGDADLSLFLGADVVNDAARQLVGTSGWLDASTRYTITGARVTLYNGVAIATLSLAAANSSYGVDVALTMDCALSLAMENGELRATLEPFNIAPEVHAGVVFAAAEDIIRDMLRVRLARLRDEMPPVRFPVDFRNRFSMQPAHAAVKGTPNVVLDSPARIIDYQLQIAEMLIFEGKIYVGMTLGRVEAK